MKNILIKILLIISLFSFGVIQHTYAASWTISVRVTEKIPGASCGKDEPVADKNWVYTYEVKKWFGSVQCVMGWIIKWFTFIAALGGVLFIVINGILYSMGGMDQGMKDEAKKRIIGTLGWLVLLFLSSTFLNIVAPWIFN